MADKKMDFITIDKRMACSGLVKFRKESFFSLLPDTHVVQIGDGRENGCYRTDIFSIPFKYCGSFVNNDEKYFAFEVPIQMTPEGYSKLYLLYESTGLEILSRNVNYVRFFYPVFQKAQVELVNPA